MPSTSNDCGDWIPRADKKQLKVDPEPKPTPFVPALTPQPTGNPAEEDWTAVACKSRSRRKKGNRV